MQSTRTIRPPAAEVLAHPAWVAAGVLLAWEATVRAFAIAEYLLPAPSRVVAYVFENPGLLLRHAGATAMAAGAGLVIGVLAGFGGAVTTHLSSFARATLLPLAVWLESIPKIAFAPLLVLWLGFGPSSRIVLVALITAFPVLIHGVRGLSEVPREVLDVAAILRLGRARRLLAIEIPFSLPFVFAGIRIAATLSVIGAVVGELVGSQAGLGYLIHAATLEQQTPRIFACLGFLGALGFGLFRLVELIERKILSDRAGAC